MSTLPFFHNYFSLTSKELEGTQGNSRELKGTQNSRELKLSMKALVEKDILMKKQEIEMRKAPHLFLCTFIKGIQGNSQELKETQSFSREALVEVIEGK